MFVSDTLFLGAEEMINIMLVTEKWKLQWWSDSKNSQQNFSRPGYMFPFKGGTLLLRKMVTMLKIRDVIHRRLASFLFIIYLPESLIIPVQKKKALLFNSRTYIYK